jgi:hypothetical protein
LNSLSTSNLTEINAAQLLIKAGILQIQNLEFSAPIVRSIFIQRIYGAAREKTISLGQSILKSSLSIGRDKVLLKHQWQMEFYCVVTTLLPEKSHKSPDVSQVFNSEGFLS